MATRKQQEDPLLRKLRARSKSSSTTQTPEPRTFEGDKLLDRLNSRAPAVTPHVAPPRMEEVVEPPAPTPAPTPDIELPGITARPPVGREHIPNPEKPAWMEDLVEPPPPGRERIPNPEKPAWMLEPPPVAPGAVEEEAPMFRPGVMPDWYNQGASGEAFGTGSVPVPEAPIPEARATPREPEPEPEPIDAIAPPGATRTGEAPEPASRAPLIPSYDATTYYDALPSDRSRLDTEISRLHPEMRAKVERVMERLREEGFDPNLVEGLRHPERQDWIREQTPGATRTERSLHEQGFAADILPNQVWNRDDPSWEALRRIAREEGLENEFDWDLNHLQMAEADRQGGAGPTVGERIQTAVATAREAREAPGKKISMLRTIAEAALQGARITTGTMPPGDTDQALSTPGTGELGRMGLAVGSMWASGVASFYEDLQDTPFTRESAAPKVAWLRKQAAALQEKAAEESAKEEVKLVETFGISPKVASTVIQVGDAMASGVVISGSIMLAGPVAVPALFLMGLGEIDQEMIAKGVSPEERSFAKEAFAAYVYATVERMSELGVIAGPAFKRLSKNWQKLLPQGLEADILAGTPLWRLMTKFGLAEGLEEVVQESIVMGTVGSSKEDQQYARAEIMHRVALSAVLGAIGSMPIGFVAGISARNRSKALEEHYQRVGIIDKGEEYEKKINAALGIEEEAPAPPPAEGPPPGAPTIGPRTPGVEAELPTAPPEAVTEPEPTPKEAEAPTEEQAAPVDEAQARADRAKQDRWTDYFESEGFEQTDEEWQMAEAIVGQQSEADRALMAKAIPARIAAIEAEGGEGAEVRVQNLQRGLEVVEKLGTGEAKAPEAVEELPEAGKTEVLPAPKPKAIEAPADLAELGKEEFNAKLDAIVDKRIALENDGISDDLNEALKTVTSPAMDYEKAQSAIGTLIRAGMTEEADLLVERYRREGETYGLIPGVPEDSPKYEFIKKDLAERKKKAQERAATLARIRVLNEPEEAAPEAAPAEEPKPKKAPEAPAEPAAAEGWKTSKKGIHSYENPKTMAIATVHAFTDEDGKTAYPWTASHTSGKEIASGSEPTIEAARKAAEAATQPPTKQLSVPEMEQGYEEEFGAKLPDSFREVPPLRSAVEERSWQRIPDPDAAMGEIETTHADWRSTQQVLASGKNPQTGKILTDKKKDELRDQAAELKETYDGKVAEYQDVFGQDAEITTEAKPAEGPKVQGEEEIRAKMDTNSEALGTMEPGPERVALLAEQKTLMDELYKRFMARQPEVEIEGLRGEDTDHTKALVHRPGATPRRIAAAKKALKRLNRKFEDETGFLIDITERPMELDETELERIARYDKRIEDSVVARAKAKGEQWEEVKALIDALPAEEAERIRRIWNNQKTPADPTYLSDLLKKEADPNRRMSASGINISGYTAGQDLISYGDTQPKIEGLKGPEVWTEEGINSAAVQNRQRIMEMDEPPATPDYPDVGTFGDDDPDLAIVQEIFFDDPKLVLPEEGTQNKVLVSVYKGWIQRGSRPPPIKVIETVDGNLKVQDGHHRIEAAKAAGSLSIRAWVVLTDAETSRGVPIEEAAPVEETGPGALHAAPMTIVPGTVTAQEGKARAGKKVWTEKDTTKKVTRDYQGYLRSEERIYAEVQIGNTYAAKGHIAANTRTLKNAREELTKRGMSKEDIAAIGGWDDFLPSMPNYEENRVLAKEAAAMSELEFMALKERTTNEMEDNLGDPIYWERISMLEGLAVHLGYGLINDSIIEEQGYVEDATDFDALMPRAEPQRPVVLLGHTRSKAIIEMMKKHGWGRIAVTAELERGRQYREDEEYRPYGRIEIDRYPGEPWAVDSGIYAEVRKRGWPADEGTFFNEWFQEAVGWSDYNEEDRPFMLVLPDYPNLQGEEGGGARSLALSEKWLNLTEEAVERHRDLSGERPYYLALQDGMTVEEVSAWLDKNLKVVGLFLGGTNTFKAQEAEQWMDLANQNYLRFHYARAGTLGKLEHAMRIGADSVDSALPLWNEERLIEYGKLWEGKPSQIKLLLDDSPQDLTVKEEDLFGYEVPEKDADRLAREKEDQGDLLPTRGPEGVTRALNVAKATVSRLEGKMARGAATRPEELRYNQARTVIRALEKKGLDAQEVAARIPEDAPETPTDNLEMELAAPETTDEERALMDQVVAMIHADDTAGLEAMGIEVRAPGDTGDLVKRYGIPNGIAKKGMVAAFSRSMTAGSLFIDDDTGKPVAYVPQKESTTVPMSRYKQKNFSEWYDNHSKIVGRQVESQDRKSADELAHMKILEDNLDWIKGADWNKLSNTKLSASGNPKILLAIQAEQENPTIEVGQHVYRTSTSMFRPGGEGVIASAKKDTEFGPQWDVQFPDGSVHSYTRGDFSVQVPSGQKEVPKKAPEFGAKEPESEQGGLFGDEADVPLFSTAQREDEQEKAVEKKEEFEEHLRGLREEALARDVAVRPHVGPHGGKVVIATKDGREHTFIISKNPDKEDIKHPWRVTRLQEIDGEVVPVGHTVHRTLDDSEDRSVYPGGALQEVSSNLHDGSTIKEPSVPKENDDLPFPLSVNDIPLKRAIAAHQGTSWTPEVRGEQRQADYVAHVRSVYDDLKGLAKTKEQKAILAEEMERYAKAYAKRYLTVLDAQSRTLSSMITGPSNFPTARNQKALDSEARKLSDLFSWQKKAAKAISRKVAPAQGPVTAGTPNAVAILEKKINDLETLQEAMKEANKIIRSMGIEGEEVRAALRGLGLQFRTIENALKPDFAGRKGFPPYVLTNNNKEIHRLKQRVIEVSKLQGRPTREVDFDGGTLVDNAEDNRVQVFFDNKPDQATRADLKKNGWKWAPSVGAWQRQRTDAAHVAAERLTGIDLRRPDTVKETPVSYGELAETPVQEWYSRLTRAIERGPGNRAPANQWVAYLGNVPGGISQTEMAFTGMDEFLKARGTSIVEMEELLAVASANAIKLDVRRKGFGSVPADERAKTKAAYESALNRFASLAYGTHGADVETRNLVDAAYAHGDTQDFLYHIGDTSQDILFTWGFEDGLQAERVLSNPDVERALRDVLSLNAVMDGSSAYNYQYDGETYNSANAGMEETGHAMWTQEGGRDYREILFQLDLPEPQGFVLQATDGSGGIGAVYDLDRAVEMLNALGDRAHRYRIKPAPNGEVPREDSRNYVFSTIHWSEKNVLFHIRMKERSWLNPATGKVERVLFVEEAQSDWHARARTYAQKRYKEEAKRNEVQVPWKKLKEEERARRTAESYMRFKRADTPTEPVGFRTILLDFQSDLAFAESDTERADIERRTDEYLDSIGMTPAEATNLYQGTNDLFVPNAPLKGTDEWVQLAFRHVMKEAVDGDFDRIAWVSGAQTIRLYDLRKYIDKVEWRPDVVGGSLHAWDLAGVRVITKNNITADKLEEHIGKEPAEKLIAMSEVEFPESELDYARAKLLDIGRDKRAAYKRLKESGLSHHDASRHPEVEAFETPRLEALFEVGIAKRERSLYGESFAFTLENADLEVGGEGHIAFYDRIFPKNVKAATKKLGKPKVEPISLDETRKTTVGWRWEGPELTSALLNKVAQKAETTFQYPDKFGSTPNTYHGTKYDGSQWRTIAGLESPEARKAAVIEHFKAASSHRHGELKALFGGEAIDFLQTEEGDTEPTNMSIAVTPKMKSSIKSDGQRIAEHADAVFGSTAAMREAAQFTLDLAGPMAQTSPPLDPSLSPTERRERVEAMEMKVWVDINGQEVNNYRDLYHVLAPFRSMKNEVWHAVFSKDGVVVGHTALTAGAVDYVQLPDRIAEKTSDIADSYGANEVYFVHNHPSAEVDPSKDDKRAAKALRSWIADYRDLQGKDALKDHNIIINHNIYFDVHADKEFALPGAQWPTNTKVGGVGDAAALFDGLHRDPSTVYVLYLNTKNRAIAMEPHSLAEMAEPGFIVEHSRQLGAFSSVIGVTGTAEAESVVAYLRAEGMTTGDGSEAGGVIDVIDIASELSMRSQHRSTASWQTRGFEAVEAMAHPTLREDPGQYEPSMTEKKKAKRKRQKKQPKTLVTSNWGEVEAAIQGNKGAKKDPMLTRAQQAVNNVLVSFKRRHTLIDPDDSPQMAQLQDLLRQFDAAPEASKALAYHQVRKIVEPLTTAENDLLARLLFLPDIVKDIEDGLYDGKEELPFKYNSLEDGGEAQVRRDLADAQKQAEQFPEVQKAFKDRQKMVKALTARLVAEDIIPAEAAEDERYYHRQVLKHLTGYAFAGVGGGDVRVRRKGFMKGRIGGGSFNTAYQEAEMEWMSQAYEVLSRVETLERVQAIMDIKGTLKKEARIHNENAVRQKFLEEGNPEDPMKPYRIPIAYSNVELAKLAVEGELYSVGGRFDDLTESLSEAYREHLAEMAEMDKEEKKAHPGFQFQHEDWFAFLSHTLENQLPGAKQAATIFKTIRMREAFLMEQLEDKYVNPKSAADLTKKLAPEGYQPWQPEKGRHLFIGLTVEERVLLAAQEDDRAIQMEEVRQMLVMGGPKEQWIIPVEVASTLDKIRDDPPDKLFERYWIGAQTSWKQWTLLNPYRALRYNFNNFSGDMDIAFAYDPKIVTKYGVRAAKDLFDFARGNASDEVANEVLKITKLGVIGSGLRIAEIHDISDAGAFQFVSGSDKFLKNPPKWIVQKYWKNARGFTDWRENILRLASYRYFLDRIEAGEVGIYAASRRTDVDAIEDNEERAAKLARELIGDYGNISESGIWMRRHMIPFYSWIEINAPRYYRLLKNLPHEGQAQGTGRFLARSTLTKAPILALKINTWYILFNLINHLLFPDEEKEMRRNGRDNHLILGRRADGTIRSVRMEGAIADALEWADLQDYPADVSDLLKGAKDIEDVAWEAAKAPIDRFVNSLEPFGKTSMELIFKRSAYPTMWKEGKGMETRTNVIRSRGEHLARLFSVQKIYNAVTGKPARKSQGPIEDFLSMTLLYATDPGEAAHWGTKGMVRKWMEDEGKGGGSDFGTSAKGNALYYWKKAVQWGDDKAAEKWEGVYRERGGNARGMRSSVTRSAPLGGLAQADRRRFRASLSDEDRSMVELAEKWYRDIYGRSR